MGKLALELTGRTFGRLNVIERIPVPDNASDNCRSSSWWLCSCSCGVTTKKIGSDLKRGNVISCGCARRENTFTKRARPARIKFDADMDEMLKKLISENKSWPYIEKRVGVCYDTCMRRAKELGLTKQKAKGGWFGYNERRTGGRKTNTALINKEVRDDNGDGNMVNN